ncbi:hypothetical protein [Achromobacter xylosoxidans]|uniref:hypothetical protein n=1 Tax=Alcaligenes xylosoxydans xylosoxydans TaxID=85698 RepID=UPI000AE4E297|nr:hypothetical protein [Achromobacter xylosoxidans]
MSTSLFVGPTLLVTAIQATIASETGFAHPGWRDRRIGTHMAPSAHDDSTSAPPVSDRLTILRNALFCVALVIISGFLVTEVVRSVFSGQASDITSTMPTKLDPQFKIALEEFRARLNSTPEFKALLRTMTPQEAMIKSVELNHLGLLKLSDADLERRANINLLLLNAADLSTCARFAYPKAEDSNQIAASTYALLARQSPAVIEDWLDLVYRAILASLQQQLDYLPSKQEIDASLQRVLTGLPQTQQYAISQFLESPSTATNEQLCAGLKALTTISVTAPAPDRAVLVRALAMR